MFYNIHHTLNLFYSIHHILTALQHPSHLASFLVDRLAKNDTKCAVVNPHTGALLAHWVPGDVALNAAVAQGKAHRLGTAVDLLEVQGLASVHNVPANGGFERMRRR
jgi:hypothetical protein